MILDQMNIPFSNSFISLLSTGLDSPIASYLMMKQGYNCLSLSFLNGGEEANKNREKILAVGNKLVELTGKKMRMHFVNYDPILEEFQFVDTQKSTCLLCKRNMIFTSVKLAHHYGAKMIVNGDILGEQASQTLDNLYVVHQINKEIPVIRPLIGFDKLDVIKISQKLQFYEISLMKGPACEFNPKFPETRAKIDDIVALEAKFDREKLQTRIFASMEFVDLG
jgi:tRNA uracil 4-sulfurtransferase